MDDRTARLAPLLAATWDAALEPSGWRTLVALLADTLGGASALYAHDPASSSGRVMESAVFEPAFMQSYGAYYAQRSPWMAAFTRLPVGTLLSRSLVPALKLEGTEYYNDWLRPQGLREALGGIIGRSDGIGSYVAVIRAADRDEYSKEDRDVFRCLIDALVPALRVHARLRRAEGEGCALLETLDRVGLAAFVLRADAGLTAHNRLADDLLRVGRAIRAGGGQSRRGARVRE